MSLLVESIIRAAHEYPEQVAFRCGENELTYDELNTQSARLASLLSKCGVGHGDLVAIRIPLRIEAPVAVFGVLRTGAAYVPIDPECPDQRLADILATTGVSIILTFSLTSKTVSRLRSSENNLKTVIGLRQSIDGLETIAWDSIGSVTSCESLQVDENSPACVIFTSGSTGEPKGIVHSHASIQAYAELTTSTYDVDPRDRIGCLSPLHFDMSTMGLFAATFAGATTVLVPPAYVRLPASLSELIARERLTIIYAVPFAFIQLLDRGQPERKNFCLRWAIYAGETFPHFKLHQLRKVWGDTWFSNAYGPTETNVCTVFQIQPWLQNSSSHTHAVPIGSPWGDTEILILGDDDIPVTEGAFGELVVCSATTMSHYWCGTPDDPSVFFFDCVTGRRYYRTGDIVRSDADGNLWLRGRRDAQVKVRGYRVEVEAVEVAIAEHPQVAEVVVSVDTSTHVPQLCASVVCERRGDIRAEELRLWLGDRLSRFAIPDRFCFVQSLPRNSNGKIDRQKIGRNISQAILTDGSRQPTSFSSQERVVKGAS